MKCDNDRSLCEHPAWSEDRSLLEGSPLDRARWLLSSEGWEHDAAALDEYEARQLAQSADAAEEREEKVDELLAALDWYMDPINQFTDSGWHAVTEARKALAHPRQHRSQRVSDPRVQRSLFLMSGLTFGSGRRLADHPELLDAVIDEALAQAPDALADLRLAFRKYERVRAEASSHPFAYDIEIAEVLTAVRALLGPHSTGARE